MVNYNKPSGVQMRLMLSAKDVIVAAICLIFLKPGIVEDIPLLDVLFNMGRFGFSIVFMGLFVIKSRLRITGMILYPTLIFVSVLLSTVINNGQYSLVFAHYIPTLGLMSWIYLYKKDILRIIKCIFFITRILIFINLITILLFPDGIWMRDLSVPVWLLGQKQDFIMYMPRIENKKQVLYYIFCNGTFSSHTICIRCTAMLIDCDRLIIT